MCSLAIWETWSNASTPGSNSTNAPKSVIRATLPVTSLPTAYFSSAWSHGFVSGNFKDNAIFSPWISLIRTFNFSPTVKTFLGFSTRPQLISEMWRSPSAPPKSMNAPKSVTFFTVPSTVIPASIFANSASCFAFFSATKSCLRSPMILLLRGLNSVITNSISCPSYFFKFFS